MVKARMPREEDECEETGSHYGPDEAYSGDSSDAEIANEPFTEEEQVLMYWAGENAEALRSLRRTHNTDSGSCYEPGEDFPALDRDGKSKQ